MKAVIALAVLLASAPSYGSEIEEELCGSESDYVGEVTSLINNSDVDGLLEDGFSFARKSVDASWALAGLYSGRENLLLKEFQKAEDEPMFSQEFMTNYVQGLVPFAAPGIVLFALSLLMCPFCFLCTKKCCFKKKKEAEEYNILQRALPLVFYMVFSTVAVALSIVAINDMSSFVDGSVHTLCDLNAFSSAFDSFLDEIITPVKQLNASTMETIDQAQSILQDSGDLGTTYDVLLNRMTALSTYLAGAGFDSASTTVLNDISSDLDSAKTALQSAAGPVLDTLENLQSTVESNLISAKETLATVAGEGISQLEEQRVVSEGLHEFVLDAMEASTQYTAPVSKASYAFFSTVFLAFVTGLIVFLALMTPCKLDDKVAVVSLKCSWVCSYFFMVFLFLLAGVFMPVTLMFSDVCELAMEIPLDMDAYLGKFLGADMSTMEGVDPIAVLQGCFATPSVPVLESLNMSSQFDFLDSLFPSADETFIDKSAFSFGALDNFTSSAHAMSPADFGLTVSSQDALNALNDYLRPLTVSFQNYTLADCTASDTCSHSCLASSTCAPNATHPSADPDQLTALRTVVMSSASVDMILSSLKTQVDDIEAAASDFNETAYALDEGLVEIQGDIQPLIDSVHNLATKGNCTFVAVAYYGIETKLCGKTFSSLGSISLLFLLIALCGLSIIITGIFINVRIFGGNRPTAVWADRA